MRFLHAFEQGEFATRPEVDLELADAADGVVVDAFGVLAVTLPARLPVPFENVSCVVGERRELRLGPTHTREGDDGGGSRRKDTSERPGQPGSRQTHGAPFARGRRARG